MSISDDLKDALDLVDETIELVENTKDDHPKPEERRRLGRELERLNSKRGLLQAKFDASRNAGSAVKGPTTTQVAQVASLSNQVAAAAAQADTFSAAIAVAGKVFDLAGEIITHA
jgi:hypothetical protein